MADESSPKDALVLGFVLIIVGAVVMIASVFLPLTSPDADVAENTLMHDGRGAAWIVILLSMATVRYAYRVLKGQASMAWSPLVLSIAAAAVIAWIANNKSVRTLYGTVDGNIDTSQPAEVLGLGPAVYVAAFGNVLAVIGSLILRHASLAVQSEK